MLLHKSKPGPRALSCITCRQRRKKCDKTKPACERCLASDFECLGYEDDEGRSSRATEQTEEISERGGSSRTNLRPILPKPAESVSFTRQELKLADQNRKEKPSGSPLDTTGFGSPLHSFPSFAETFEFQAHLAHATIDSALTGLINGLPSAPHTSSSDSVGPIYPTETHFDDLRPQNQSQSLTRSASSLEPTSVVQDGTRRRSSGTSSAINALGQVMNILCRNIPPSVNADASMRESYYAFTIGQFEMQRGRKYFRLPPVSLQNSIIARMKRSRINVWFLYLGAKIFEQLNESPRDALVQPFVHWINECDQRLTCLDLSHPVEVLETRLSGLLELVFLNFVTVGTRAGYSLLQRCFPVFLAAVSADPVIWVERHGLLLISIPHILASPRVEIKRFVSYDIMIAFALGIPSLAQYDTGDFPIIPEVAGPMDWVHGIPIEFSVNIVQVNAWRASNPGIPNMNDWLDLELRALAWTPRAVELGGGDSYEVVARLAVQECWRNAILIYIYMGMCCVDSHDPRVQYSARQIIQLMNVISASPLDVHLFLPSLTAGIAARYEHHRAAVRNKLASFHGTRAWLLPGTELITVLDHLWHGVAADGAPVAWEDYVCSRRAVLPLTGCSL